MPRSSNAKREGLALCFGIKVRLGGHRLQNEADGRGDWTRTSDLYVPNVAPYRLGHTPTSGYPTDWPRRPKVAPLTAPRPDGLHCSLRALLGQAGGPKWTSSPRVVDVQAVASSRGRDVMKVRFVITPFGDGRPRPGPKLTRKGAADILEPSPFLGDTGVDANRRA